MARLNWNKLTHAGRETAPAVEPKKPRAKGGWTHIKQQPVRVYTKEEIAVFVAKTGEGN